MLVCGLLARMSRRIPRDSNTLKLSNLIRTIKVVSHVPFRRFPPFRNAGLFSPEYSLDANSTVAFFATVQKEGAEIAEIATQRALLFAEQDWSI